MEARATAQDASPPSRVPGSGPRRALIVGAGLAGLAAATSLSRLGWSIRIIDSRNADAPRPGAGLLLTSNGFRALAELVPAPKILNCAYRVSKLRFQDSTGAALFDVDCQRPDWSPVVSARHSEIWQRLMDVAAVRVEYGMTVDDVRTGPSPAVVFSDGSRDTFDLVIGADGVHSKVRQLLFGATAATPIGNYRGFRCVIEAPPSITEPVQMLGNGRTLLLYPLPNDELYLGAGPVSPQCYPQGKSDLDTVREVFADFGGVARDALDRLDERTAFIQTSYWNVHCPRWGSENCLLIGDAAHASAPSLAQGGAMAFEDAVVLGHCLGAGLPVNDAIETFVLRRKARTDRVQRESLSRMDSNRFATTRELAARNAMSRKFGAQQLTKSWDLLANESP